MVNLVSMNGGDTASRVSHWSGVRDPDGSCRRSAGQTGDAAGNFLGCEWQRPEDCEVETLRHAGREEPIREPSSIFGWLLMPLASLFGLIDNHGTVQEHSGGAGSAASGAGSAGAAGDAVPQPAAHDTVQ